MRASAQSAVLVWVQDLDARRAVVDVLHDAGISGQELTASVPHPDLPPVRCQAIVFDLFPWDGEAKPQLRALRARYWFAKVLLLPPARAGIATIIRSCADIAGTDVELQLMDTARITVIRKAVENLLRTAPLGRTQAALQDAAPVLVERFPEFADAVVWAIGHPNVKNSGHLVTSVAHELGASVRAIDHFCQTLQLPEPRELADTTLLLWLTGVAELGLTTTADAARRAGVSADRLCRIRKRALPQDSAVEKLTPRTEFYAAFRYLALRCRTGD